METWSHPEFLLLAAAQLKFCFQGNTGPKVMNEQSSADADQKFEVLGQFLAHISQRMQLLGGQQQKVKT